MTVYMFVMNNCSHDARVLKEARSLTQAGYRVKIIALLDKQTVPYETRDGFEIIRVLKDPLHYKLLRVLRKTKRLPHRMALRLCKEFRWWRWWGKKLLHHLFLPFKRLSKKILAESSAKKPRQGSSRETARGVDTLERYVFVVVAMLVTPLHGFFFVVQQGFKFVRKNILAIVREYLRLFIMLFHRPLSFLDYYIRAYRIVRSSPGDIYHAHDLNTLPVAWWARKRLGGKLVYDSHELYTETSTLRAIERRMARMVERMLIGKCDRVITVNDSIAQELVDRYRVYPPAVIMNCPDMLPVSGHHSLIQQKLRINFNDPIILYQGGFSPNRGLENLLLAFHYIPKGELVFMGWGKLEDQLRDQAEENGWLNTRVFFLPPVPQRDLLLWTASADVGVIPYRAVGLNNYYTLPNKLFEYMAAGIPVAASAFPELKKIVEGHGIGVTFDPEDPKDIARAIKSILDDAKAREQMRINARKAAKIYNWEREEKKLIEIYRSLDK